MDIWYSLMLLHLISARDNHFRTFPTSSISLSITPPIKPMAGGWRHGRHSQEPRFSDKGVRGSIMHRDLHACRYENASHQTVQNLNSSNASSPI